MKTLTANKIESGICDACDYFKKELYDYSPYYICEACALEDKDSEVWEQNRENLYASVAQRISELI